MEFRHQKLRQQFGGVQGSYAKLAAYLTEVAQGIGTQGALPAAEAAVKVQSARKEFDDLGALVHALATEMLVSPLPKIEDVPTLVALDALLTQTGTAEENRHSLQDERSLALAVLAKALAIVHREGAFGPLTEYQAKVAELRKAVEGVLWPARHPDAAAVVAETHTVTALLRMVSDRDAIDDEKWIELEETVTKNYGKPLSVAASRGKLELKTDAAPAKPATAPAAVAATPAAPAPAAAKPAPAVAEVKAPVAEAKPAAVETKPAAPQAKPAAAEAKPAADVKAAPAVAETKPAAVAEAKPVVAEAKPAVVEAKPAVVVEAKPAVVEAKPVVVEAKPVVVEAKPAAAEAKPVVVEAKPAAAEAKPVVVEAKPAAAEAKPAVVEAKPVEVKTAAAEVKTAVAEAKPAVVVEARPAAVEARPGMVVESKPAEVPTPVSVAASSAKPAASTATATAVRDEKDDAKAVPLGPDGRPQRWGFWRGNR